VNVVVPTLISCDVALNVFVVVVAPTLTDVRRPSRSYAYVVTDPVEGVTVTS
jgi:hypothetical protein